MRCAIALTCFLLLCRPAAAIDFQNAWDSLRKPNARVILDPGSVFDPSGLPRPGTIAGTIIENPRDAWRLITDPKRLLGVPLAEIIVAARDRAYSSSRPMPLNVRNQLAGFVPDYVLNRARYTTDQGTLDSVPIAVTNGCTGAAATTLIDVIVFQNEGLASNPVLWAHELWHVYQYMDLGLFEFARQYSTDYNRIERPAYASEEQAKSWLAMNTGSNVCQVHGGGQCFMQMQMPRGTNCYCLDNWGRQWPGSVR